LLKRPPKQRWRQAQQQNTYCEIFSVKNATEQRNLGTLAYKIKCKWEKAGEESRTEVGREQE